MSIDAMRRSYDIGELPDNILNEFDGDPMRLFAAWWDQVRAVEAPEWFEPNAMTVSTSSNDVVASRILLLKGLDHGFIFYTNYLSAKGKQLAANPQVALNLYWAPLERQVRIEGQVEQLTRDESDRYFATRPVGSRIGAWASNQSQPIASRDLLDEQLTDTEQRFANADVSCPPHWGGYRVVPTMIEFWQGRTNRMHDRIQCQRENTSWNVLRLQP